MSTHAQSISESIPGFVDYMKAERGFSPVTVHKYRESLRWFIRIVGDRRVSSLSLQDIIQFKARMNERGTGPSRTAGVLYALKAFLAYARNLLHLDVIDTSAIRAPRSSRRPVSYLTDDEIKMFFEAVPLRTRRGKSNLSGYCFRALLETLLATGMRISEALSLKRTMIDFDHAESLITGKGNKQRSVFFTPRALEWIRRYLDQRSDSDPALFVTMQGTPIGVGAVQAAFRRHAKWLGFVKPVSPHIIRHTTATHLLRNGCPVGAIKEILGHENLETTCRFYLGTLSKADTQRLHQYYSQLDLAEPQLIPQISASQGSNPRSFLPYYSEPTAITGFQIQTSRVPKGS